MATECKTPGEKIRSKGKGRGLARGKGKGPLGIPIGKKKDDDKTATVSDMYKLGYEYGVREKLAQLGGMGAVGGPALTGAMTGAMPKAAPTGNKPNWPTSMPQHGGATTPIANVKKQMQGVQPGQLKPTLSAQM